MFVRVCMCVPKKFVCGGSVLSGVCVRRAGQSLSLSQPLFAPFVLSWNAGGSVPLPCGGARRPCFCPLSLCPPLPCATRAGACACGSCIYGKAQAANTSGQGRHLHAHTPHLPTLNPVQGFVLFLCGSTGLAGDSLRYVRMLAGRRQPCCCCCWAAAVWATAQRACSCSWAAGGWPAARVHAKI